MDDQLLQRIRTNDPHVDYMVNLSHIQIGREGIKLLSDALKLNNLIRYIDLGDTDLWDEEVKILADALKVNIAINMICLKENQIGPEGVKTLTDVLKVNTSIRYIDLSFNPIRLEGLKTLADFIKVNPSITTIWLYSYQTVDEGNKLLVEALQYNYTIKYICIFGDSSKIKELLKYENRKQRIIEWMPWKNHHICKELEPRFHDIILTLLYLFFIPQIFLRREKLRQRQKFKKTENLALYK